MKPNDHIRTAVGSFVLSLVGLVPASAQIRSDWSPPVNLTALNSSAADA